MRYQWNQRAANNKAESALTKISSELSVLTPTLSDDNFKNQEKNKWENIKATMIVYQKRLYIPSFAVPSHMQSRQESYYPYHLLHSPAGAPDSQQTSHSPQEEGRPSSSSFSL